MKLRTIFLLSLALDMATLLGAVQQVTARDYCDFLNHVAPTDVHRLYNATMSFDSYVACIVRLGKPGGYHYQVIAGRENIPIPYTNFFDEARYCNWLENKLQAPGNRLQEDMTETGVYDFHKGTVNGTILKNPNADYFICNDALSWNLFLQCNQNTCTINNQTTAAELSLKGTTDSSSSNNQILTSQTATEIGLFALLMIACHGMIEVEKMSSLENPSKRIAENIEIPATQASSAVEEYKEGDIKKTLEPQIFDSNKLIDKKKDSKKVSGILVNKALTIVLQHWFQKGMELVNRNSNSLWWAVKSIPLYHSNVADDINNIFITSKFDSRGWEALELAEESLRFRIKALTHSHNKYYTQAAITAENAAKATVNALVYDNDKKSWLERRQAHRFECKAKVEKKILSYQ